MNCSGNQLVQIQSRSYVFLGFKWNQTNPVALETYVCVKCGFKSEWLANIEQQQQALADWHAKQQTDPTKIPYTN